MMKIIKFTPVSTAGSMAGFLDIETNGIVIRDIKLMVAPGGGHWLAMPAQKQLDRDGNPVIGDNGKQLYREFIGFRDRDTRDKFRDAVLDVLQQQHPEAFDR